MCLSKLRKMIQGIASIRITKYTKCTKCPQLELCLDPRFKALCNNYPPKCSHLIECLNYTAMTLDNDAMDCEHCELNPRKKGSVEGGMLIEKAN